MMVPGIPDATQPFAPVPGGTEVAAGFDPAAVVVAVGVYLLLVAVVTTAIRRLPTSEVST